jgi:hypothetical protein
MSKHNWPNWRDRIFFVIRTLLVLSMIINAILFIMALVTKPKEDVQSKHVELIILALITYILTFGPDLIEAGRKIDIPDMVEITIVIFIYAGIFVSGQFNLYYAVFWWDDLLHFLSGMIIGFIGVIMIYRINQRYHIEIPPFMIALFAFSFAITMGVFWEMLEFAADALTGSAHQKWDLPPDAILAGEPYQGTGLRDTMSDLIVDTLGALLTSASAFAVLKRRKMRKERLSPGPS